MSSHGEGHSDKRLLSNLYREACLLILVSELWPVTNWFLSVLCEMINFNQRVWSLIVWLSFYNGFLSFMLSLVCILWLWCALIYFIQSMMLWLQLFNLTLNRHCYKSYWYKGHLVSINCSRRCHAGRNPGTKHISRHIHQDMLWHSATYLKWYQNGAQVTQASWASFWSSLQKTDSLTYKSRHKTVCPVGEINEDGLH